jgi:hypothetical protein
VWLVWRQCVVWRGLEVCVACCERARVRGVAWLVEVFVELIPSWNGSATEVGSVALLALAVLRLLP